MIHGERHQKFKVPNKLYHKEMELLLAVEDPSNQLAFSSTKVQFKINQH